MQRTDLPVDELELRVAIRMDRTFLGLAIGRQAMPSLHEHRGGLEIVRNVTGG